MSKRKILDKYDDKKSRQALAKERMKAKKLKYKAEKLGCLDKNGNPDFTSYHKHLEEQTAKNAGFIDEDGKPDLTAYYKHIKVSNTELIDCNKYNQPVFNVEVKI
ncbi:hypothetical protein [Rickettsia sp. TH2014]|uniref:hypothetical protein n=1 Tax=Rickettsia sp. TH2014 TaxID=1967503 RepID=UPI001C464DEF|nr:hypothetical protein [Rickettsia sp. TH2014]